MRNPSKLTKVSNIIAPKAPVCHTTSTPRFEEPRRPLHEIHSAATAHARGILDLAGFPPDSQVAKQILHNLDMAIRQTAMACLPERIQKCRNSPTPSTSSSPPSNTNP